MSASNPQEAAAIERVASAPRSDDVYNPVNEYDPIGESGQRTSSAPTQRTLTNSEPAAPAPPAGGRPQKYSHGLFDPEMAPLRKIYLKIVIAVAVLTILVMWACLPFYWGALAHTPQYAYRLSTFIVDFDDNSAVTQAIVAATQSSMQAPPPFLGYNVVESGRFSSLADVANAVHEEEVWAAIVINRGAAEALELARQTGDASYTATSAVTAVYNQGRNELAAANFIVPQFAAVLAPALAALSAQSAASYLQANSGNATAIAMLVQAPSTLVGYSYSLDNIHPYDVPVATAITLVGLIYLLVLSFIQTMGHGGARAVVAPYLTNRAYLTLRCVAPLVIYLPVSFFFSMISLAFKVPFNGGPFTNAGGFFLTAFLFYLGMAALGLATEFALEILTAKFVSFFLVCIIVANVAESSWPLEISGNHIYRVGAGLPFYNLSLALRTILFGTKNHIARTCGILLGWIGLSLITISLSTWLLRRKDVKAVEHERKNGAPDAAAAPEKRV